MTTVPEQKKTKPKPISNKNKKNTNTKTTTTSKMISQTLPTNFKYGLPVTPHINPQQPILQIPKQALSFQLPPVNPTVGTNITKLGSLSLKESMSMPAAYFMGPLSSQGFKLTNESVVAAYNQNPTLDNKMKGMKVGSFPIFQVIGGRSEMIQLIEDDNTSTAASSTPDTFAEEIEETEDALFTMDD